jgi:hypothetical protein
VAWPVTVGYIVMSWAIQKLIVFKSIVWVLKTSASTVANFGFVFSGKADKNLIICNMSKCSFMMAVEALKLVGRRIQA